MATHARMNDDPEALTEALNAAAVLGAALAQFENALDRLKGTDATTRTPAG